MRRTLKAAAAMVALTALWMSAPTRDAFAGGITGTCTDSGSAVSCGSGVSSTTGAGSGAGGGGTTTSGGGATTVSVPTCPNYVPYSSEFPGQDGGPPPASATQPGAWFFNTCATGGGASQATGVVWLATGQAAPTVPPPDPAVAGAQAASELQLPIPT